MSWESLRSRIIGLGLDWLIPVALEISVIVFTSTGMCRVPNLLLGPTCCR